MTFHGLIFFYNYELTQIIGMYREREKKLLCVCGHAHLFIVFGLHLLFSTHSVLGI